jgi:hypothetical protein
MARSAREKEPALTEPVEERRYPERRGDGGPGEHGARLADRPYRRPELPSHPDDGRREDKERSLGGHRRQVQRHEPPEIRDEDLPRPRSSCADTPITIDLVFNAF